MIVCADCDAVLEQGDPSDDGPPIYETCDRCERAAYEAERDEAAWEFEQMWP